MVSRGQSLVVWNMAQSADSLHSDASSHPMLETRHLSMSGLLRQLAAENQAFRDLPPDDLGRPRDPRPPEGVQPGSPLLPRPGATRLRRGSDVNSDMVAETGVQYEPLPPAPPLDLVAHPPGFSLLPPVAEEIEDDESDIDPVIAREVIARNEVEYEALYVAIERLQRVQRERCQREQQEQQDREQQERQQREQQEEQQCEQQERQQL